MSQVRENRTFFGRIAANPTPALVWLGGALLLLAVEFSAFVDALILFGEQINPLVNGSKDIGGWYVNTMYDTLGVAGGTVMSALGALVVLAVFAVFVKAAFIPFNIVETLGLEDLPISTDFLERAIVGAFLAVLWLVLLYEPLAFLPALPLIGEPTLAQLIHGFAQTSAKAADWIVANIPTLLSRDLMPNQGFLPPEGAASEYPAGSEILGARIAIGPFHGTFLGLSPAVAWAIRVVAIYLYAFIWLAWVWQGYKTFRRHYRFADWTPRDDMVDRLRTHRWGQFGFVMVFLFLVMAMFAPALGPTTTAQNIYNPYGHEFQHVEDGEVETITHGTANLNSASQGTPDSNVGVMSYDDYGRFHPIGTLSERANGKDLFTFMADGARVSLFIGLLSIALGGFIATALAMVTAYYKGLADLIVVVTSDSVQALPGLLIYILLSVVFSSHPISNIYSGGFLLALIFAATGWPALWRAIRGPAFQVSEEEWIDAAKSYGQRPSATMRKHMLPYVAGYLLIYGSLTIGGIIISVAALSFLGLGVQAPTPEWGRAVNIGRPYVTTVSWHIATIPGLMVVFVVTGFNALGDGIRDAIDPQSEGSGAGETAAAGGGG
ncbi:ABC transporter permease [Haloarchaeobius litoreus]|uniref:ABC transporter permease n=1 Tax=Haloarchaeobius litoreus TaxID=755306 RepID=A0ABD6DN77_9EURY|nr:ABC transporter permease [Haloarchaeobius litoreus]